MERRFGNCKQILRPGFKLLGVKGIVMHWTANPGASDTAHKSFFDGSDGGGSRYAGAHIFVDSDSATLIVPLTEVAYHANEKACKVSKLKATASYYTGGGANLTTIGIEMCVEKDGTIHKNTVQRCVNIVAELCKKYKLNPLTDVYRHFDITGKTALPHGCPIQPNTLSLRMM
ncbi:N-acetylmuramoyl-L-alanine amidase [Niallia circulans]